MRNVFFKPLSQACERTERLIPRDVGVLVAFLTLLAASSLARAQCEPVWSRGNAIAGTEGQVNATIMWDTDGSGPEGPSVVLGGEFAAAGDILTRKIVRWNPQTGRWHPLGSGLNGNVASLAIGPDGCLIAGGSFTEAGGQTVANVAAFDGSAWHPLGGGVAGNIAAMKTLADGRLVVTGTFTSAGGVPASNIAVWNGSTWSSLGSGINGRGLALEQLASGELVVGGMFTTAGGTPCVRIAKWNGLAWSPLGSGGANDVVMALRVVPGGDLVAGGYFTSIGGTSANAVARWNGSAWSPYSTGLTRSGGVAIAYSLELQDDGRLLVGGWFTTAGGLPAGGLARWEEDRWQPLPASGKFVSQVTTMTRLGGGRTVIAGFSDSEEAHSRGVAMIDGDAWDSLSPGTDSVISDVLPMAGGKVLARGDFRQIGGVEADRLAMWNGSSWQSVPGSTLRLGAAFLCPAPNGKVLVTGVSAIGETPVQLVAQWDGAVWSTAGSGLRGFIRDVIRLKDGRVLAAGSLNHPNDFQGPNPLMAFDGNEWSVFSPAVPVIDTRCVTQMLDGRIVVAGSNIIISDASGWSEMGLLQGTAYAACVLPNGDLVVGGGFSQIGGVNVSAIAKWDGTAWSSMGGGMNGMVCKLATLPNGDLIAAGTFTTAGGVPASSIARWTGEAWTAFGGGIDGGPRNSSDYVRSLRVSANGEVLIAGRHLLANGQVSANLARFRLDVADMGGAGGLPGSDGLLDNNDFIVFINTFFQGSTAADIGSAGGMPGADGSLDNNDFIVFIDRFFNHC